MQSHTHTHIYIWELDIIGILDHRAGKLGKDGNRDQLGVLASAFYHTQRLVNGVLQD